MAEKRRFLDVWILESNTVYREVPYSVVTDWVQEGRLLEEDRLRPSGTAEWFRLGSMPAFAPYLPRAEPHRAEDQAEALEPVQVELTWKRSRGAEEEDVDMIPLIDVSLVLLIFFMMTAAVGGAAALFDTPAAKFKLIGTKPQMLWVGINRQNDGGLQYSLGKGDLGAGKAFDSKGEMLRALDDLLQKESGPAEIRIRADRQLPINTIQDMTLELTKYKRQGQVIEVYGEVSEKTS